MNKQQAEAFAKQFTESFAIMLPKGFVKCSTFNYDTMTSISFDIGDRNVAFDAEEMEWYAQDIKCDPDWLIEKIK